MVQLTKNKKDPRKPLCSGATCNFRYTLPLQSVVSHYASLGFFCVSKTTRFCSPESLPHSLFQHTSLLCSSPLHRPTLLFGQGFSLEIFSRYFSRSNSGLLTSVAAVPELALLVDILTCASPISLPPLHPVGLLQQPRGRQRRQRQGPCHPLANMRTVVVCCGRGLLLRVLGLGLLYQLLLLLVLVLRVLSSLCRSDFALVGEAVEDAKGEGGPPEDLEITSLSALRRQGRANCTRASQGRGRCGTAAVGHCEGEDGKCRCKNVR